MAKNKDNVMAILAHILGLFIGFIGPLITFLVGKDDAYALKHSKSALNWQLSLLIYMIVSGILAMVLIGFVLMAILGILNIVFSIKGAINAANNKQYVYPFSIKFFKV